MDFSSLQTEAITPNNTGKFTQHMTYKMYHQFITIHVSPQDVLIKEKTSHIFSSKKKINLKPPPFITHDKLILIFSSHGAGTGANVVNN